MIRPEQAEPAVIGLSDAIAEHTEHSGIGQTAIARRAGISPARLESLVREGSVLTGPEAIEAVARVLELPAARLREYRLAFVLDVLARDSERVDAVFRETLSPIERRLVGDATFSDDPLAPTVWRLLALHELTQGELADGIGWAQPALSRVMNGHDRWSVTLLEQIAQALDVAPEVFIEYRLALIEEWLRKHPERGNELFLELSPDQAPSEHLARQPESLPNPGASSLRPLIARLGYIMRRRGR